MKMVEARERVFVLCVCPLCDKMVHPAGQRLTQ